MAKYLSKIALTLNHGPSATHCRFLALLSALFRIRELPPTLNVTVDCGEVLGRCSLLGSATLSNQ